MGWWGQGGCERRFDVFVKISKKMGGGEGGWGGGGRGRVGGVRVDVNGELKFLGKFTKKIGRRWGREGGGSGGGGGSGWRGVSGWI